ncbi:hypothetical protein [Cryobacterium sp.]|jgi:acetyl-CoA carboxylase alpha subunit|uniref:hypothetical protein n=1 Tax=Cryobacterium sp. TaxID=1926290 RepID=UPI00345DF361|nr:acetyl-CoA carboxyl transferase [Cryobacterium sp.]
MHGDTNHAAEMAESQRIGAVALQDAGIVDWIVPELPDAAAEPAEFSRRVGRTIEQLLPELRALDAGERLRRRRERYRSITRPASPAA